MNWQALPPWISIVAAVVSLIFAWLSYRGSIKAHQEQVAARQAQERAADALRATQDEQRKAAEAAEQIAAIHERAVTAAKAAAEAGEKAAAAQQLAARILEESKAEHRKAAAAQESIDASLAAIRKFNEEIHNAPPWRIELTGNPNEYRLRNDGPQDQLGVEIHIGDEDPITPPGRAAVTPDGQQTTFMAAYSTVNFTAPTTGKRFVLVTWYSPVDRRHQAWGSEL